MAAQGRSDRAGRGPVLLVAWGLIAAVVVMLSLAMNYLALWSRMPLTATDLWVFREGGRFFLDGSELYFVPVGQYAWLYPPFGALALSPLSLLPVEALSPFWWLLNLVLLISVVLISFRPLLDRRRRPVGRWAAAAAITIAAVATAPVADLLGLGQIGLVLLWLCLIDVVALKDSRWQGVLVGAAAAIKLTPLVFLLLFLVSRRWRAVAVSVATLAALWALAAVVRPDLWAQYVGERIALQTSSLGEGFDRTIYNQSIRGLVDGLSPAWLSVALWVLLSVAVLTVSLLCARWSYLQGDAVLAASLAGLAGVLASPISWHHHGVWVVPAIGALVGDGRSRWRLVSAGVAVMLLLVPPRTDGLVELPPDRFVLAYLVLQAAMVAVAFAQRRGLRRSSAHAA